MVRGGLRVSIQQVAQGDAEGAGQAIDHLDRRVSRPTFQIADVGAVDTGLVGEALLAQALGATEFLQVFGEAAADIFHPY